MEASEVVHYRTYEDCLEAVNSGRADATSMPVAFAEGLFIDHSFSNITPATSEHHEAGLSFALAKPVDTELYSIMSKAVNSFSQDELDTIASHNSMPSFGKQRTIQALVSENPLLVVALSLVLCLFVGAIVIVVSVAKVRNRMMEMKLEKVEEMGRAKTDFLSRMSHEIRTPMNAIIGLSSVASLSGEATPSIRSSLEKINMSAQFLLSLVNDILDMSKIEDDKMRIETAPLRLRSLAERLQSMFFLQAEDKGVLFETRCDADDVVVGDDVRLQQVLANLLSNALKFTDPGDAIRLSVVVLIRDEGSARVRFSVEDTGAGIREEDLERIFVSFEQASENRRNAQGTGLGLAISSNLVRLMGGRLDVQSRVGEGSEFFFVLELPTADEEALGDEETPAETADRSLAGTRVLLAEDNDLNAEIAVALLDMQGVEARRAANGREAVDMFDASEPGAFDFVLMDVKMPLLDGLAGTNSSPSGCTAEPSIWKVHSYPVVGFASSLTTRSPWLNSADPSAIWTSDPGAAEHPTANAMKAAMHAPAITSFRRAFIAHSFRAVSLSRSIAGGALLLHAHVRERAVLHRGLHYDGGLHIVGIRRVRQFHCDGGLAVVLVVGQEPERVHAGRAHDVLGVLIVEAGGRQVGVGVLQHGVAVNLGRPLVLDVGVRVQQHEHVALGIGDPAVRNLEDGAFADAAAVAHLVAVVVIAVVAIVVVGIVVAVVVVAVVTVAIVVVLGGRVGVVASVVVVARVVA